MNHIARTNINPFHRFRDAKPVDKATVFFGVIVVVLGIATEIYISWQRAAYAGPLINAETMEGKKVKQSLETICRADAELCAAVKMIDVKYYLVNERYLGRRTEIAFLADENAKVTLYPRAFENEASLNVQLYHRLLHVTSKYGTQREARSLYSTCVEHNRVKKETYRFAQQLDAEQIVEAPATTVDHVFYASGWGNAPEQCSSQRY